MWTVLKGNKSQTLKINLLFNVFISINLIFNVFSSINLLFNGFSSIDLLFNVFSGRLLKKRPFMFEKL